MMNVVAELKKERERLETDLDNLDRAIHILTLKTAQAHNGRKPAARRWSAASRAKQAARMRAMWKSGKFKK